MLSLQWYMISVVYVYHRMKSCEVLCYINGRLALRQDVGFVNTSEVSSVISSDPNKIFVILGIVYCVNVLPSNQI